MNALLTNQISRLTNREKLDLADQLLQDAGSHEKPSGIHRSTDEKLVAELNRRLGEKKSRSWLSGREFRITTKSR